MYSINDALRIFLSKAESFKILLIYIALVNAICEIVQTKKQNHLLNLRLSFIKLKKKMFFSLDKPVDKKLLKRLRLSFSNLNKHKLRHNVKDAARAMYEWDSESTQHLLLLPFFTN